jgi:hypothetical protein
MNRTYIDLINSDAKLDNLSRSISILILSNITKWANSLRDSIETAKSPSKYDISSEYIFMRLSPCKCHLRAQVSNK